MQPEHAEVLRHAYVAQLKAEYETTKRVLAAVPAGKGDYAPDPKSMKAMDLAWHIATSELWFMDGVAKGEFKWEKNDLPADVRSGADVVARYEGEFAKSIARIEALSGDHLVQKVKFGPWENRLIDTLGFAIRHSIHHRGQLAAYLRPMGAKVPSIYGPSADEPMAMPAEAAKA